MTDGNAENRKGARSFNADRLGVFVPAQGMNAPFLYKENPALDAGFKRRYAFDQNSSN